MMSDVFVLMINATDKFPEIRLYKTYELAKGGEKACITGWVTGTKIVKRKIRTK